MSNNRRKIVLICADLRKYFFTNRALDVWNSLPNHVVLSNTVNTFKSKLDKFWQQQPIIYDFKAEIQRVGCVAQWAERRSLAGELTLSCARPAVDG